MPGRTAPKRSRGQRAKDLVDIAKLYSRKKSHEEIKQWLNLNRPYKVTRQQVTYDLADIREQWRDEHKSYLQSALYEELKKIDRIEAEAWDAWDRSKGEITRVHQEKEELPPSDSGRNLTGGAKRERTKATVTKEISHGDTNYMHTIQWCVDRRAEILGLKAAAKLELSGPDGGPIPVQHNETLERLPMDQVTKFLHAMAKEVGAPKKDSGGA